MKLFLFSFFLLLGNFLIAGKSVEKLDIGDYIAKEFDVNCIKKKRSGKLKILKQPKDARAIYALSLPSTDSDNLRLWGQLVNRLPALRDNDIRTTLVVNVACDFGKDACHDLMHVVDYVPVTWFNDVVSGDAKCVEFVYKPLNGDPQLISLAVNAQELGEFGITQASIQEAEEDSAAFLQSESSLNFDGYSTEDADYDPFAFADRNFQY